MKWVYVHLDFDSRLILTKISPLPLGLGDTKIGGIGMK